MKHGLRLVALLGIVLMLATAPAGALMLSCGSGPMLTTEPADFAGSVIVDSLTTTGEQGDIIILDEDQEAAPIIEPEVLGEQGSWWLIWMANTLGLTSTGG